jgi:hypothetical protein
MAKVCLFILLRVFHLSISIYHGCLSCLWITILIYFRHSLLACPLYNQGSPSSFASPLRIVTVKSNKKISLHWEDRLFFFFFFFYPTALHELRLLLLGDPNLQGESKRRYHKQSTLKSVILHIYNVQQIAMDIIVLSHVFVTIHGVWICNRIYWTRSYK